MFKPHPARGAVPEFQAGQRPKIPVCAGTKCTLGSRNMPEENADKAWDEYDWERFLQEQERRTEKYMGLLEKYMDHPDRDSIIAREMGWKHLIGGETREWEEEVESSYEDEAPDDEARPLEELVSFGFERHPLYRETIAFSAELDEMFVRVDEKVREHPAAINLRDEVTLTAAKLAAALNDDDIEELGMSIAYLKRGLRALTASLNAAVVLHEEAMLGESQFEMLRGRIFSIRDGIVSKMGEYRSEFRRRRGER